jgi:two-component system chemotaxis response regulator CheB
MKKMRVLTLASSSVFAASLARDLSSDPGIELAASVFTDRDALKALNVGGVNVVLCDGGIPGLSVRLFAQRVQQSPKSAPVIFLAKATDITAETNRKFVADILRMPPTDSGVQRQTFIKALIASIKAVASASDTQALHALRYKWRPGLPFASIFQGVVAIGASAGGTEATEALMRQLPSNMPGIVITQHMPPVFTKTYAERLDRVCQVKVHEAKDGDEVRQGVALVAPGGLQMRVQRVSGNQYPVVRCRGEERVSGHCPSVDVLFESVANSMGAKAIGIILTGMGSDGAEGLLSMRKKGCQTYGQDESTSMVYGMPRVAHMKGAVKDQLPLGEIPQALCSHLMSMR